MPIRRLPPSEVAVDVDEGRGAKGVQLGRRGGKGGGENNRQQQPDETLWQVRQDEGDKDVVGIRRRERWIGGRQHITRLAAERFAAAMRFHHLSVRSRFSGRIIASPRCHPIQNVG